MATMQDALKEAYAGTSPEFVYHCLEIRHSNFTQPIRIVRNNEDCEARTEVDAPLNPGEMVSYVGAMWEMTLPKQGEDTMPEISLSFDNVSREITEHLQAASQINEPIKMIYRVYTDSTLTSGPQIDPPIEMEIGSATADVYTVTTRASLEDVFRSLYPYTRYTPKEFPSLGYA